MRFSAFAALWVALLLAPVSSSAENALIAVATNFATVAKQLQADFEQGSDHTLDFVAGSTGKLYAQITNGAPFDVLLAADRERPRRLEEAGLAVRGTRQTYAAGRLVLWSPDPQRLQGDGAMVLRTADFRSLAIANPRLAPYGGAAVETLQALNVYADVRARIVMGENVGQAHAMVASGNAELGLLALSSVESRGQARSGSHWTVPPELYAPIRQDGILLARGSDNPAARAFLQFLGSPPARELIERYGYGLD